MLSQKADTPDARRWLRTPSRRCVRCWRHSDLYDGFVKVMDEVTGTNRSLQIDHETHGGAANVVWQPTIVANFMQPHTNCKTLQHGGIHLYAAQYIFYS
jgi:hypothetical protein